MNAFAQAISARFAPPSMTLRDGRFMDDHGDESYAKIPVNHRTAADVTDEALEYYQDVWAFLDPNSLLFYFAPVTDWLIAAEVKNLLVVELREKESSPLHCVRV